jgi:hypothetical protein
MRLTAVVFGLWAAVAACSDTEPPSVTGPVAHDPANVTVSLNVTGDPSAGLSQYPIFVDGTQTTNLMPNDVVKLSMPPGLHEIGMHVQSLFPGQYWCLLKGASQFSLYLESAARESVQFNLDCPPLDGTGTLILDFTQTGPGERFEVAGALDRTNGPPITVSFVATPGVDKTLVIPPGLYKLRVSAGFCTMPITQQYLNPSLIVRTSGTSHYSYTMTCT